MLQVGEPAPARLLDAPVLDAQGRSAPLRSFFEPEPALLLFLRHYGCVGCIEQVARLTPRVIELVEYGVRAVYIGSGAPEHVRGFIAREGLSDKPVVMLADPQLESYAAADMKRSLWNTIEPRSLVSQMQAIGRGFRPGGVDGDPHQQGGGLLLDAQQRVAWIHRARFTGDNVDGSELMQAVLEMTVARRRREGGFVL